MIDKKRVSNTFSLVVIAVIVIAVLLVALFNYAETSKKQISKQLEYAVSQNADVMAYTLDSYIGYAISGIQVTSMGVTNTMTSPTIDNPGDVLDEYIDSTPFNSIEYITADGINMTTAGEAFDASGRGYYIHGIEGETGLWINFHPKYSEEPLLNFYTPLYYNEEISGVLTGTMGGNTTIRPLFMSSYADQPVVGILLDENNQIIASTEDFEPGLILNWSSTLVPEDSRQDFLNHVYEASGESFTFEGANGEAIASVSEVKSYGWKVIQIVPSGSVKNLLKEINNSAYLAIAIVLAVSAAMFVLLFLEHKRISDISISKANSERDEQISILYSMADIYYSMHLINLTENSVIEYSARNEVKTIANQNENAIKMLNDVIHATITDEYLDSALSFTDLTTIPVRMINKKTIFDEFNGKHMGWMRFAFITIDKDDEGKPTKVILTTQCINDEKLKEQSLIQQSNTDKMTEFFNRRAYEDDVAGHPDVLENFVYVSLDVNELKIVNDNYGHAAGDELLIGAATCMRRCLGNYGRLYRIGGDEFAALIYANEKRIAAIKEDLENTITDWSGKLIDKLSISFGFASKKEFPDATVTELAQIADERMYEAKALYYKNKGFDRRGQAAAHTALCALYAKILKINITEDTFQIINMDSNEQNENIGFANTISGWFEGFANSRQIHHDDVEEFLEKTNLDYLRKYFKSGKVQFMLRYRRATDSGFKQVIMEIIPTADYSDDNQNLYLYVKAIE